MLNAFGIKNQILFTNCEELRLLFESFFLKTQEDISVEQVMKECSMIFTGILYCLNEKIKQKNVISEETQRLREFIDKNVERELSIQEIAERLGYKNGDYFSKQFRYTTGMTATMYGRKNI